MRHIIFISILCLFMHTESVFAQKRIVINSQPADAEIYIDGKPTNMRTPAIIKNPGGKSFSVTFRKEGYEDGRILVIKQKQFNGKKGYPQELSYRLIQLPPDKETISYVKDPTITQGAAQQMVTRDDPGQTSLEQTIIRWFFDSDPRGARISWRVVSSIPAIVKNTNETYLTTTPYEETRAFNILGLTYENSRDVQIEIKVTKKGYEDQVKRFNVRQAIDQQEISGFFELVGKEIEE